MKHTNTCWHDSNGLVQKYIGTAYDKIKLVADNLDMLQELVDSTEGIQLIYLLTNKSQLDELNTDYFRVARMYDTDNYEYYDDYMFDLEFDEHGEPKRDEEGKLLGTWNMLGSVFKDTYEDVTNEVIAFQKDKVVDVNVLKAVKIIGAEATSEEFGTVKIFATLGDSEEGTITQKALTDIITIIQKDTKHAVDTAEDALHKAEVALDSTVLGIVSDEEGNDAYKANSQRLTNELLSKLKHKNILGREETGAHPASTISQTNGRSVQHHIDNTGIQGEWVSGTSYAYKDSEWWLDGVLYKALQDTSVDPVGDDVNWRAQPDEWVNCRSAEYVSPTSFKIVGNFTGSYAQGRKVRLDSNDTEYGYSTVLSSSYAAGETTVVVLDAVVKTGLIKSCASVVSPLSSLNPDDISSLSSLTANNVDDMSMGITDSGRVEINPNQVWITKGRNTPGDGGTAQYINRGQGWPEVADGYVNIAGDDGSFFELITFNGGITDKSCGVIGDGVEDDTSALKAFFDNCNLTGRKAILLSDEILTDEYKNTAVTSLVLSPVGETKITLRSDGQFLIWIANNQGSGQGGQFIVDGPVKFDGAQFGPSIDGGLLQLNSLDYMELNGCDWRGFKKTVGAVSNGLATTGEGRLVLNDCSAGDCAYQLLYAQNRGGVVVNNPDFGESDNHGISHANCGKFEVNGGKINTVNGYGILVYSTSSYRGNAADITINGTDLRNNVRPFEIARRYEQAEVSGLDMNIILKDVDCRDCDDRAVIGNASTDNVDGFTVREMTVDGIKIDYYIEIFNTKVLRLKNIDNKFGESLIRLRNKVEKLYLDDSEIIGNGNASNSNTVVYIYANAEVQDIFVNNVKSDAVYSLVYAESGATFNGKFKYTNYENTNPVAGFFLCNTTAYNKIGFDRGNRPDRNMAQQSWSADGSCPFYDTDSRKILYWDGTNQLDAIGTIVS